MKLSGKDLRSIAVIITASICALAVLIYYAPAVVAASYVLFGSYYGLKFVRSGVRRKRVERYSINNY